MSIRLRPPRIFMTVTMTLAEGGTLIEDEGHLVEEATVDVVEEDAMTLEEDAVETFEEEDVGALGEVGDASSLL